jgi:hypothetical protein
MRQPARYATSVASQELDITSRLLKNSWNCHPEVAPILRDRRICFIVSVRKQQILRFAQDDTLGAVFSAACLGCQQSISFLTLVFRAPVDRMVVRIFFEGHAEDDEQDGAGHHQDTGKHVERQFGIHRCFLAKVA